MDPNEVITVEVDEARARPVTVAQGTQFRWVIRLSWDAAVDLHDQLTSVLGREGKLS